MEIEKCPSSLQEHFRDEPLRRCSLRRRSERKALKTIRSRHCTHIAATYDLHTSHDKNFEDLFPCRKRKLKCSKNALVAKTRMFFDQGRTFVFMSLFCRLVAVVVVCVGVVVVVSRSQILPRWVWEDEAPAQPSSRTQSRKPHSGSDNSSAVLSSSLTSTHRRQKPKCMPRLAVASST